VSSTSTEVAQGGLWKEREVRDEVESNHSGHKSIKEFLFNEKEKVISITW